jgi:nitrite reductase (NADH) small subunit
MKPDQLKTTDGWIEIGEIDAIPKLGARVIHAAEGDIAVFRTAEDDVFALRDSCPHQGGPLSQGIVYGKRVACPLHNWSIHLESGRAVAPDEGCTAAFPIKIVEGKIYLLLKNE